MSEKPKRLPVFQCQKAEHPMEGIFVPPSIYWEGKKGPNFETLNPPCPYEACCANGKFLGMYVPEGTIPKPLPKAGKHKMRKPTS